MIKSLSMMKSLRVRIQFWHAVILSLVLIAFGIVFYQQLIRATVDQIDADLITDARALEGTLRTVSPQAMLDSLDDLPLELPPHIRRRPGPPPPRDAFETDSPQPNALQPDHAHSDHAHSDRRPPPRPYFAIYSDSGTVLFDATGGQSIAFVRPMSPLTFRTVNHRREAFLRGPNDTWIVVGRDIQRARDRLTSAWIRMVAAGTAVLTLGLVGGWWLSGKAIEPIHRISQTAAGITSHRLADRVDTTAMDVELQSLATTLNAMLSRLENSFEQQSRFTADASHELRTPIAVILSQCELALRRPRSSDEYSQTIVTCEKAGIRMKDLVENLLTLARADAGLILLNQTDFDLMALAMEIRSLLQPLASERRISIAVTGSHVMVNADVDRIRQVITNLVHNAIAYNVDGGGVTVETTGANGVAMVRVVDTGIGIPADAIEHLFDRFYRVDPSRSRSVGGNGLGLAICKSIVDSHGGTLTVASEMGRGSSFEMQLPVRVETQTHRR